MTDISRITRKAAETCDSALSAVEKYISLFHPDIFGSQKKTDSAEEDFFRLADTLKLSSEIFFQCVKELLIIEETLLSSSPPKAADLHKKAVLLSEINDLCIEPFLKEIYIEAIKPTVDVGRIRQVSHGFSVKLQNYKKIIC